MKQIKPFKELEFCDAFMFAATMEDEEICRKVLERVLEMPIKTVKVHTESMILINPEYRGIRMDVYADDEQGTVFDVEMQTGDKGNLAQRSRFYQSQMDVAALEPEMNFNRLPSSYVIFICTFDPFGYGLYRYTFENKCRENGESLKDGTCKVFLNTRGSNAEGVTESLINFLGFVEHSSQVLAISDDSLVQTLNERINYLKRSRRMEERYMLFGEMLDDERKVGMEAGIIEGQKALLSLISAMNADGRINDLPLLHTDPEFLQRMMEKYQIQVEHT